MPQAKSLDPYESPLAFFGAELRRMRVKADMTQDDLGRRLSYSRDLVGKIETATKKPQPEFLEGCDEVFDTDGLLTRLWDFLRRHLYPNWLWPWVEAEAQARTLRSWQPLVIDGLLQTEEYARELLGAQPGTTEERVEEQVAARLDRQKILHRDEPPLLWVLLAEDVLHYRVGGPATMRDQLQALIQACERPRVTVQVVPMSAEVHSGRNGAFAVAGYDGAPDVVYLESARAGHVSDHPEDVQAVTDIYDAIRAEALPARASAGLIAKVREQWT